MNLLFLMTDQQRFDCVGYLPGAKVPTPQIDRIAEGIAFTGCQTVNPVCQPARTALLTGRYSHQIGTLQMAGDLNFQIPTFPQALQKAGYWTAGVGKFHYLQSWNWDVPRGGGNPLTRLRPEMQSLGYDHVWETAGKQLACKNYCDYGEYLESKGRLDEFRDFVEARGANKNHPTPDLENDGVAWPFPEDEHIDIVTGRKIREAIDRRAPGKPFFIFGSFCSPHKPFDPPKRFLDAQPYEEEDDFIPESGGKVLTREQKHTLWKLRRAYKATVRLIDEEVGKILGKLEAEGLLENTMIVFTSDHGEMMGDHYRVQKSSYYRASLNVPLAIRHPGHLRGMVNDSPVELTDIAATLLDAAGVDPEKGLGRDWPAFNKRVPCRSLMPIISGQRESVREYAFSEFQDQWQCIVSHGFKYIKRLDYDDPDKGPEELLFDIGSDPNERFNRIHDADCFKTVAWHRRRLQYTLDHTPPLQSIWAPLL